MGCTNSKQAPATKEPSKKLPSRHGSLTSGQRKCHYCGKMFPLDTVSQHTIECEDREIACHHSWCRKIFKQRDLKAHMHECQQTRRTQCPKCGESVPSTELTAHRGVCDVVQCEHCPERCIPRMIKYCPNVVLGRMSYRVGPFAIDRLREKFVFGVASPTSRGSPAFGGTRTFASVEGSPAPLALSQSLAHNTQSLDGSPMGHNLGRSLSITQNSKPLVNFQVARIQHLWRWAKAKAAIEDLLFRVVYKELDNKKETFSIFKAHDHRILDEEHRARKKLKSSAPVQAVAPTSGHYFPANASEPLTVEIVNRVIDDFTNKVPLPYHAVWRIFTDANNILKSLPNITRLSPPEGAKQVEGRWHSGGKVVVVGDLHGQIADLLTILHDNALPSERCLYVFNGDFVDRGHFGMEIVLLLFLLLIVFPNYVALNRGNHECEYMNEEYGFDIEVQTKFDRNIFKLVQRCFCALPLATVIGSRVFVVHGGLPRQGDVTFDEIDSIQRFRQIPMPELAQPEEDEIFQDLMWSDPQEENGWVVSSRGVGTMFGPDVTNEFLKTNKLELVIRSHEEFAKGHEFHHRGKLMTVFSASNYDGPGSNMGATVTLMGDSAEFSIQTWAVTEDDFILGKDAGGGGGTVNENTMLPPPTPHALNLTRTFSAASLGGTFTLNIGTTNTASERFGHFCASLLGNINLMAMTHRATSVNVLQPMHRERRTRDEVVHAIRERIYERRHRLLAYFTKIDRTQRGSVWKMEWVETVSVVLNLDLPWFFLRPSFTHTEPISHRIHYVSFLSRFRNGMHDLWFPAWSTAALADIYYQLNGGRRRHPVAKTLQERTEPIGYNEFCTLIRQVSETASDNELFHLFLSLANDGHWNSFITGPTITAALEKAVNEFENDPQFDEQHEQYCGWDLQTMDQLASVIVRLGGSLLHKVFGVARDEHISTLEVFEEGLNKVSRGSKRPLLLRPPAVKAMWQYLLQHSVDPERGITVDELLLAFAVRDFTSLRERREAFNELTARLLGEKGCLPLRRRYSTTFLGFGPTPPVEFLSPNGSTIQHRDPALNTSAASLKLGPSVVRHPERHPTAQDTPPPGGGPPSAYSIRAAEHPLHGGSGPGSNARGTPTAPNHSMVPSLGVLSRNRSMESVGNSLEDPPHAQMARSPEASGPFRYESTKQSPTADSPADYNAATVGPDRRPLPS